MSEQATQEDMCAQMGAPGDEHRALDYFEGTWNAKCTFWMAPGQEPMHSSGVMKTSWTLGGRQLEMRYQGEFAGGEFQGIGYWGFNKASGKYESVWMDTAGTMMMFDCDGSSNEGGKVFRSSGMVINPENGQPMRKSVVTTIKNDNEHTYEMFFGDVGQEFKSMQIDYTRA